MPEQVCHFDKSHKEKSVLSDFFPFRYIHVILPREEGKAAIDTSPKKIKKTKSLVRAKNVYSFVIEILSMIYTFFFSNLQFRPKREIGK
jgi:hypothetical protein